MMRWIGCIGVVAAVSAADAAPPMGVVKEAVRARIPMPEIGFFADIGAVPTNAGEVTAWGWYRVNGVDPTDVQVTLSCSNPVLRTGYAMDSKPTSGRWRVRLGGMEPGFYEVSACVMFPQPNGGRWGVSTKTLLLYVWKDDAIGPF
jgi:hypothetical protein